jgi:tRNA pseudouridine55 synthase
MSLEEKLQDVVLPVDKKSGITTFDCIRRFKKIFKIKKVGHAGSLDPIASGLVLLLTGEATKLSNYLMDLPKRYRAEIKLGQSTDTQDAAGKVISEGDWKGISREDLEKVIPQFVGKRYQKPPVYSALKHKGKPLYKLARKGRKVEKEPRQIETFEINLLSFEPPMVIIDLKCSRGLYVRTLAEEIGERLGVPAHLSGLTRISIGHFDLEQSVPYDHFEAMADTDQPAVTMFQALEHMPAYHMSQKEASALTHGIPPAGARTRGLPRGVKIRLARPDGGLGGIAETDSAGIIKLKRVLKEGS